MRQPRQTFDPEVTEMLEFYRAAAIDAERGDDTVGSAVRTPIFPLGETMASDGLVNCRKSDSKAAQVMPRPRVRRRSARSTL